MTKVRISDTTLKQKESKNLTFRERLEITKLLDRLGIDIIELPPVEKEREDSLFIKSVSDSVKSASICVCVSKPAPSEIDKLYELTSGASKRRIQIAIPTSSVQMEYFFHKKADAMLAFMKESVTYAKSLPGWEVELCLRDAARSDKSFLAEIVSECVDADVITFCDDDSVFLPEELLLFLDGLLTGKRDGAERKPRFAISVTNRMNLSDINSVLSIKAGVEEIKAQFFSTDAADTENVVRIIEEKTAALDASTRVGTVEISRVKGLIQAFCKDESTSRTPFQNGVRDEDEGRVFTALDSADEIFKETDWLGYDLSVAEKEAVFRLFSDTAQKKGRVTTRDLEAIVASSALLVPSTYVLDYFIINSGNTISATSHVRMHRGDEAFEEVSVGDGPIDASFLAIEKITGHHYELDDFQIQTVSEGREAMGRALVKLRSDGKIYSGFGVSTDIIGSSIMAYVNALNKIEYEKREEGK